MSINIATHKGKPTIRASGEDAQTLIDNLGKTVVKSKPFNHAKTSKEQAFENAALDLFSTDRKAALSLATGVLVGMVTALARGKGHDPDAQIVLDGGADRDIIIGAKKTGGAG